MFPLTPVSRDYSRFCAELPLQMVASMRALVKDSFERLAALVSDSPTYSMERVKAALKGGVWYPVDYLQGRRALRLQMGQEGLDLDPEVYLTGYMSRKFFDKDQTTPLTFRAKKEVTASAALEAALQGPSLVDCTGAYQLATYQLLRETFGKERFDKIFQGSLVIGYAAAGTDLLFKMFIRPSTPNRESGKIEISPGKLVYFENDPRYRSKHPFGFHAGLNAVYAGKGKYLSFVETPEGQTREAIQAYFIKEFNQNDRRLNGLVSDKLDLKKRELQRLLGAPLIDEDVQITPPNLPKWKTPQVAELWLEAIYYLRLLPPQKITATTLSDIKKVAPGDFLVTFRKLDVDNLSEHVRTKLPHLVVSAMRALVKDASDRLLKVTALNEGFNVTEAKEALKGGVWYPEDFIRAYRRLYPYLSFEEKKALPSADLLTLFEGHCPKTHFKPIPDEERNFRVRQRIAASEAVAAALRGPTLIDSRGACQLAYYHALDTLLGRERFDKLFNSKLVIGDFPANPLHTHYLQVASSSQSGAAQLSQGIIAEFQNDPHYIQKHPFGSYQAYHMVYAGNGRYLGLGALEHGLTRDEVHTLLIQEYQKKDPTLGGIVSAQEYLSFVGQRPGLSLESLPKKALAAGLQKCLSVEPQYDRLTALLYLKPKELTPERIEEMDHFLEEAFTESLEGL